MKIIRPEDLKVLSIQQLEELFHDVQLVLEQKEKKEFDEKANDLLSSIQQFIYDYPNALFVCYDEWNSQSYEVSLEQIVKIAYDNSDID